MSLRPALLGAASALLFAAATPASKVLLGGLPPLRLAGILYAGAFVATLPVALAQRASWRPSRRDARRLALAVIAGGVVAPGLLLLGLQRASAASVSLWLAAEAVATAALAALWFREHFGPRELGGVALVAAGIAAAALGEGPAARPGLAVALVLAACVAWALDNNLTSVVENVTPAQVACAKGLVAAVVNLGAAALLEPGGAPAPAMLAGGLLVGGLAFGASISLFVASARGLGALRAQLIFATAPLLGAAMSWVALGERMTAAHATAVLLVGSGLAALLLGKHAHDHEHEATVHAHAHRHDDGHHDHEHDGLPASTWHAHEHAHGPVRHSHHHHPDLHHRHAHR